MTVPTIDIDSIIKKLRTNCLNELGDTWGKEYLKDITSDAKLDLKKTLDSVYIDWMSESGGQNAAKNG